MARRKLDPIFIYLAREMIQHHAAHELMARDTYEDLRKRGGETGALAGHIAEEEHEHYEMLKACCPPAWGDFDASVRKRIERRKGPGKIASDLEFLVASWIFDFAGLVQIEAVCDSSFITYRNAARRILKEELEHGQSGLLRLAQYLKKNPSKKERARALIEKWTKFSLTSFGSEGSVLDKLALRHKLKKGSAAALKKKFLRKITSQAKKILR